MPSLALIRSILTKVIFVAPLKSLWPTSSQACDRPTINSAVSCRLPNLKSNVSKSLLIMLTNFQTSTSRCKSGVCRRWASKRLLLRPITKPRSENRGTHLILAMLHEAHEAPGTAGGLLLTWLLMQHIGEPLFFLYVWPPISITTLALDTSMATMLFFLS